MKKLILMSAAILFVGLTVFAQNSFLTNINNTSEVSKQELSYSIHGCYERAVYKETMDNAKIVSDFIDGYPTNWIDEYVSVEILAINNGQEMRAISSNDKLTAEQKIILKSADLNSDVDIKVKYKSANTLTDIGDVKSSDILVKVINIRLTVVPETEAQYAGGAKEMNDYLKNSFMSKIPETVEINIKTAEVLFTVSDKGNIEQVKLFNSTGDAKTDQLMIESIRKMPKWKPAENAKGVKVKQYFKFTVGVLGC